MADKVRRRVRLGLVAGLLALAAAASAGCFADILGSEDGPATARQTFEYDTDRASTARLRLFGKSGDITVTALAGSDSIRIRAVLEVSAENADEAAAGLSEFWVDVDQRTNELIITTAQPSGLDTRDYVAHYEIEIPQFMFVLVRNVSGDITMNGIGGDLYIQNGSGTIALNDSFGSATVQIANGSVDARVFLPLFGALFVSTGNGDIDVAIPENTSAELLASAGNGTVSVSNLTVSTEYQTSNAISGQLGDGLGLIQLASGNGSVTLVGY
ncbi:MAG: DUF4097 family beta strand repeat-containing protein [Gemmatimonadales bacterium]